MLNVFLRLCAFARDLPFKICVNLPAMLRNARRAGLRNQRIYAFICFLVLICNLRIIPLPPRRDIKQYQGAQKPEEPVFFQLFFRRGPCCFMEHYFGKAAPEFDHFIIA